MEMLLIVLSACITGWLIPTVTVAATEGPYILSHFMHVLKMYTTA